MYTNTDVKTITKFIIFMGVSVLEYGCIMISSHAYGFGQKRARSIKYASNSEISSMPKISCVLSTTMKSTGLSEPAINEKIVTAFIESLKKPFYLFLRISCRFWMWTVLTNLVANQKGTAWFVFFRRERLHKYRMRLREFWVRDGAFSLNIFQKHQLWLKPSQLLFSIIQNKYNICICEHFNHQFCLLQGETTQKHGPLWNLCVSTEVTQFIAPTFK